MNIFLSHSSKDKPFARRLGNDLRNAGAFVWIDEAEIKVGDSLIEKISGGLNDANFILATLSKNSVKSEWVKLELNIAITKEIGNSKVIVLPCIV